MIFKSKIKWAALGGLLLSLVSLVVHLTLAKYSTADIVHYNALNVFAEDLSFSSGGRHVTGYTKLWSNVQIFQSLLPYSDPSSSDREAPVQRNGFIYAKIFGDFEKIRTSIPDLVAVSRLLNATLVIPEFQESSRSKGISSKYTSFSYLYNKEHFIEALKKDVIVVESLPPKLKEAWKQKSFSTFKPTRSASPSYYIDKILPLLKEGKVIGLLLSDAGCLQNVLPPDMGEYQRLRCRVAFHALQFRSEISTLGNQMVERLRAGGQPYLAYNPGLTRDTLALHGCAELFQDVHTELIQHRRKQLIKQNIIKEDLSVDSYARKRNGSCPLMPEEVGLLLRSFGYPARTRMFVAGSEVFGGQRVLVPLRAMYPNLVDRTSLCSNQELLNILGPENPIPMNPVNPPPPKTKQELKKEWDKAGPRPRPLPPPAGRLFYSHEKEGWYGWVAEKDEEPAPSLVDIREKAHRLIWEALDYIVSVEADVFFPGFTSDSDRDLPSFSSLVMGHRFYKMAALRTYRPNRRHVAKLFGSVHDRLYYPKRNWTISVREHLNKSLGEEGLAMEIKLSKAVSFLSHPFPECSCRASDSPEILGSSVYRDVKECPKWMDQSTNSVSLQEKGDMVNETPEEEAEVDTEPESDEEGKGENRPTLEEDDEMDPDD